MPQISPAQLDVLLAAIRDSDFLNLTLANAAKLLGTTQREMRVLVEAAPELELVQRKGANGAFYVVRPALAAGNLARLAPVTIERLRKAYGGTPDRVRALEEALSAGGEAGPFHVAGGMVHPGHGESEAVKVARAGAMDEAPPPYDQGPFDEGEDLRVLGHLEDLEAERINFGVYETFVSFAELHERIVQRDPGLRSSEPTQLVASVERLRLHQYLLRLGEDRLRSRISEMVRVLKRVKQRFRDDDADTAPYLIHSVKVHFENRKRLERKHPLEDVLERVFQENRGGGRKIDRARKALQQGFAAALGKDLNDVNLTRIQKDSLGRIAADYFARDGKGYVISGNTGSGKTEAALLPLLLGVMEEKLRSPEGVDGCKVVLVYPRQELAKNQLQRLCRYMAYVNRELEALGGETASLSAGIVFGDTPVDSDDLTGGKRKWEEAGNGRILPFFVNEDGTPVTVTSLRNGLGVMRSTPRGFDDQGWELEGFRATREAVMRNPPDVLVITTEMLHRWLMDPAANPFFGLPARGRGVAPFVPPRAVVFDEIHLYDTVHGAQIGMLLRRLRHRLIRAMHGQDGGWRFPLVLGMSATIGNAQTFWSELSGVPEALITPIIPEEDDLEAAQGREYFLFIRPETYSRGKLVGDASVAIQTIMTLAHTLRRRAPDADEPAKHRSLVFQDSISKVRKLALEFTDAETNRFLARFRLKRPMGGGDPLASPEYHDGEFWVFDAEDPFQYSERRTAAGDPPTSLSSPNTPVFGGNKGTHLLTRDILFATSVLEVGYDDPSIQFVLQHHAPRNAASFVQKKGRAGRSLQDRPVTAVTLSRHSYRDAFYFQNPRLLYDPADYRPPLNVENYFVHQFQALALLFDELARLTGRDFASLPYGSKKADVVNRVAEVEEAFGRLQGTLEYAYEHVTEASFRRIRPRLREVWDWFRGDFDDKEVIRGVLNARNLLKGHPQMPDNLFGTINLPTLRVMHSGATPNDDWESIPEDVALAFGEVPAGKVTRRYGRGHRLFWRPPHPWVEVERYKPRDGDPGPFNPALLRPLDTLWGSGWADYLPRNLHRLYGAALPDQFYRARFVELWDFGTLNPRDPKEPQPDWVNWGELLPNGEVKVRFSPQGAPAVQDSDHFKRMGDPKVNPWRRVLPDSNSYPLSSAYVRPHPEARGAPKLSLPPLFPGLLDTLQPFWGEVDGKRSALDVWEIHYGAEATVRLRANKPGDPFAGTGHALVRYRNGFDGKPTLYGYDLTTEGLRVPYDADRLQETAAAVFAEIWADPFRQAHLQDQYLRYLLKTEAWPKGAPEPMNVFDVRLAAELISTLRAESRAGGVQDAAAFLDQLTDPAGLAVMVAHARARYWRDARILNDEFVARLTSTLTWGGTRPFLDALFHRIRTGARVQEFLQVTLLHSLKHAVRHLFITEGSTRDEEVGSFGMFRLTHSDWSPDRDFYIYERNQDGNGATRLVVDVLNERGRRYGVERWWDVTLACPVGDEEDFLRAALRQHGPALRAFTAAFLATPPPLRQSPAEFLAELFPAVAARGDASFLARLAGILTTEVGFGGGQPIALVDLQVELQEMEDALAAHFRRAPTPMEVAGYAATEVENDPAGARFPSLGALRQLYRDHAHRMAEQDDEAPSNELERFMDQVQHLSLSTCTDACAACLASDCDMGHIEVMRHTLSRRYLKRAHQLLSAPFTVALTPGVTGEQLTEVARANGGWAILTYQDRIPDELALAIHDRFDIAGRIFDHERLELRAILHLEEA